MSNDGFRGLIYYFSSIINIYVNNQSASEKFVKKGQQIAEKTTNEFLKGIFAELDKQLKEIKKDPRDLIEKLIGLSNISIKDAFTASEAQISKSDIPAEVYSAEEIREFYTPIVNNKFGDPNEVIATLEKALKMTKNSNDPRIIAEQATILYYLGASKISIEEYTSAEDILKKGLEIAKQVRNDELVQRIQRLISTMSDLMEEY